MMKTATNIYEADFKGFFDSINLEGLSEILRSNLQIPNSEVEFIKRLNMSIVKLTEEDKVKERDRGVAFHADGKPHDKVDISQVLNVNLKPEVNPKVGNLFPQPSIKDS